jgi:hypothetical protein
MSAGIFFWFTGNDTDRGHSDSGSGLARPLTPSGPRCGLKRCAFDQAIIEYWAFVKAGLGLKKNSYVALGTATQNYLTLCIRH